TDLTAFRNSALLKTRTYLGLLTPCLALHGSQRMFDDNQGMSVNLTDSALILRLKECNGLTEFKQLLEQAKDQIADL
ncbi:hypothetical protein, partial [Piscirickettsia salmonis]|uniref:hypothetical protein n=1 Tax=Piscirickettsia salmonis TaxID=1238 RepID=UPI003EBB91D7